MSDSTTDSRPSPRDDEASLSREELRVQYEILAEQHDRLRNSYLRARKARYTRTAVGFALLGVLALAGAFVFPATAEVLFSLAAIGLFGALLITFLTPETFISTDVSRDVFTQLARTEEALVDDLALADVRRYIPPRLTDGAVRLFVPEHETTDLPSSDALASLFVLGDRGEARGISLRPTGAPLFETFERSLSGGLSDDPESVAAQLCDGLVEQFELVESASPDVDAEDGRVTVAVTGSVYGPLDRLNHPVTSFVAVGLARAVDAPVTVMISDADGPADYILTCRWDAAAGAPTGDDGE